MRKQDQLSALIASLGRNEKRYFKLQASLHSGDKTFKRLFDELAKGKAYEPESLSKKLNISKPLLAQAKMYLEKVLLSSLRLYEQDSLKIWFNNQLQSVQILYSRNQFELAFSINEKALERALAYDSFMLIYNFLGLKFNLLVFLNREEEAVKVNQQKTLSLGQLSEVEELTDINKSFRLVAGGGQDTEGLLEKTAQKAIFNTEPQKLKSNSARILWHEMKQNYYCYVEHNLETAIHHNLCKLDLFEAQPQLIYSLPFPYLTSIGYLSSHYGKMGNYQAALNFASKLELETDGHRNDIPAHMCRHLNLAARSSQVYLLCYHERFEDAAKKAAEIENEMHRLQPGHFIITKHHQAQALFYTGKYDEALKACETLHNPVPDVNTQNQLSNRLLLVMIHFELKNYNLLPHFISSATTWAKRHKVTAPGTAELIRWFRKFEKISATSDRDLFFKKFDEALQKKIFKDYARELGLNKWVQNNLAATRQKSPKLVSDNSKT